MYALNDGGDFDALFGGFIWSHIPLETLGSWLDYLHGRLKPGSRVVFADNNFVPGSNTPIATSDGKGNVFQKRKLLDGEEFLILKNFPERRDFEQLLKGRGQNIQLISTEYYWLLEYETSSRTLSSKRANTFC